MLTEAAQTFFIIVGSMGLLLGILGRDISIMVASIILITIQFVWKYTIQKLEENMNNDS